MSVKQEEHQKRIQEQKALKLRQKREREQETKRIQAEAKARKAEEKARKKAVHEKRQREAQAVKERKLAERREKHAAKAAEQEAKVIEKKKREVTIEFSDFQSIKHALSNELRKYGEVENVRRTLSGCEARFTDQHGAQEAVAAGEVEATINLTVQASEIKQHSIHFFPQDGVEINPSYLKSVKTFFSNKCKGGGSVSVVSKKRGAVVVGFSDTVCRDRVSAVASPNWTVDGSAIGDIGNGFPQKAQNKKHKGNN